MPMMVGALAEKHYGAELTAGALKVPELSLIHISEPTRPY